jgi:hypothetical protein
MSHEAEQEKNLSRRSFLKFGGLLGLAMGAFSLPSLAWGEASTETPKSAEQEPWLEARKRKKAKKGGRRKTRAAYEGHIEEAQAVDEPGNARA